MACSCSASGSASSIIVKASWMCGWQLKISSRSSSRPSRMTCVTLRLMATISALMKWVLPVWRADSTNTLVSLITRTESGVRAMRLRMLANSVLIWLSSCSENRQSVSTQKKRLRTMSNGALGSAFSACSPRTSELQPTPPGPYSSTELALLRMRMDVRRFSASSRPTSLKPGRAASISEPEIRYWFVIRSPQEVRVTATAASPRERPRRLPARPAAPPPWRRCASGCRRPGRRSCS